MSLEQAIRHWQERLLQLDRNNSLLYYPGRATVTRASIIDISPDDLLERFHAARRGLSFPFAKRVKSSNEESLFSEDSPREDVEVRPGDLKCGEDALSLQRRLQGLYRKNREWEEEQGINVLFLALGFLVWIDDDGRKGLAPMLLAPATLHRESPHDPWFLTVDDDDLQTNETLRYRLQAAGVQIPGFEGSQPSEYFRDVQNATRRKDSWSVLSDVALSTFPFAKMAMWSDLESMREKGTDNPLVHALSGDLEALHAEEPARDLAAIPPEDLKGGALDDLLPIRDQFTVLDADHSQLRAIELVRRGGHAVIHGPPGTGKSQTIANIIASLLGDGKRVLFVSEKTAALDVVKRRLAECNLDLFALDLHSDRAKKSSVYDQLRASLKARQTQAASFPLQELEALRSRLNDVVRALHEVRDPLGKSVFQVHGRYARVRGLQSVKFATNDIEGISEEGLLSLLEATDRIGRRPGEFLTHESSPWRALRQEAWTVGLADTLRRVAADFQGTATDVKRRLSAEAESLHISSPERVADADLLERYARHMQSAPGVPSSWLSSAALSRLRERAKLFDKSQENRRQLESRLLPLFGPSLPDLPFGSLPRRLSVNTFQARRLEMVFGERWESALCPVPLDAAVALRTSLSTLRGVEGALESLVAGPFSECQVSRLSTARAFARELREGLQRPSLHVPEVWVSPEGLQHAKSTLQQAKQRSDSLIGNEDELFRRFDRSILEVVNLDMGSRFRSKYQTGFRFLFQNYRADMRLIRGALRTPGRLTFAEAKEAIDLALRVAKLRREWSELHSTYITVLGPRFRGHDTDWKECEEALDATFRSQATWRWGQDGLMAVLANQEFRLQLDPKLRTLEQVLSDSATNDIITNVSEGTDSLTEAGAAIEASLEIATNLAKESAPLCRALVSNVETWGALVNAAADGARLQSIFREEREFAPDLRKDFGSFYSGSETEWKQILDAITWSEELLALFQGRLPSNLVEQVCEPAAPEIYRQSVDEVVSTRQTFLTATSTFGDYFESSSLGWELWSDATFSELDSRLAWFREHVDSAAGWLEYRESVSLLESILGEGAVDSLRAATEDASLVRNLVLRHVYGTWLQHQYASDERLRFQPRDHEAYRKQFKELDQAFVSGNSTRVRQRCLESYPNSHATAFEYGQLGTLKHQLSLKRRQLPVRRLLQKIPRLVQALKPCFLMSPVAVSQFLSRSELATDGIEFDAVLFDEASQIFPEDAVPAISRGYQVVVVGDQKQLPPTSFFRAEMEDDDVGEDDGDGNRLAGVESILDVMVAMAGTGVHDAHLRTHYRSRHEDLIRYSNHYFYEDGLLTFPSPELKSEWLGIRDIYLAHGQYDAGGTRTNRAEADRVVDEVFRVLSSAPLTESVGVVTLSRAQADLVEELILHRRLSDSSLEKRFAQDINERFFVKNLENVQGDERDHIFLCIGYGPVGTGRTPPNRFGPINREGGERRLNVAVSRARRSLTLIRSLRPEQIVSQAPGARLLRRFLEFAQDPAVGFEARVDENPTAEVESPFEEAVQQALVKRGHMVARQVGCFGYRIDLAIADPDGGSFDLGIECDGATYHSSPAARDRDWLRQQVLEGLGWTIHRVWSTDWIKDPGAQVELVERALSRARQKKQEGLADHGPPTMTVHSETPGNTRRDEPDQHPETTVEEDDLLSDEGVALGFRKYEVADLEDCSRSTPILEEAISRLRKLIRIIVESEGPIHVDYVIDWIRRIYGAGHAGNRIRKKIETAIRAACKHGSILRRGIDGEETAFLDLPGRPERIPPRGPAHNRWTRQVEMIWPGEIEEAILRCVKRSFGIHRNDALVVTARGFGYLRTGQNIRDVLEETLDRLIAQGEIQESETGLSIPA